MYFPHIWHKSCELLLDLYLGLWCWYPKDCTTCLPAYLAVNSLNLVVPSLTSESTLMFSGLHSAIGSPLPLPVRGLLTPPPTNSLFSPYRHQFQRQIRRSSESDRKKISPFPVWQCVAQITLMDKPPLVVVYTWMRNLVEKNSISVHMNELRPVEECEVCVTPFYRLLWTFIWGNCEDCGNIGVDHVCVLVRHYRTPSERHCFFLIPD